MQLAETANFQMESSPVLEEDAAGGEVAVHDVEAVDVSETLEDLAGAIA